MKHYKKYHMALEKKSIGQQKAICFRQTDGLTLIIEKLSFKNVCLYIIYLKSRHFVDTNMSKDRGRKW